MDTDKSAGNMNNDNGGSLKTMLSRLLLEVIHSIADRLKRKKANKQTDNDTQNSIDERQIEQQVAANKLARESNDLSREYNSINRKMMWGGWVAAVFTILIFGYNIFAYNIAKESIKETKDEFNRQHQAILQIASADTVNFYFNRTDFTFQIINIGNEAAKILYVQLGLMKSYNLGESANIERAFMFNDLTNQVKTLQINRFIIKESPYTQHYSGQIIGSDYVDFSAISHGVTNTLVPLDSMHYILNGKIDSSHRGQYISIGEEGFNAVSATADTKKINFIFFGYIYYVNQGTGSIQANVFRCKLNFDAKKSVDMLVNNIDDVAIQEGKYYILHQKGEIE